MPFEEAVSDPGMEPDRGPSADLTPEQLREIFYALALHRATEERLELLHKQGHVGGGVYRGLGQEAVGVGVAYALQRRTDGMGDVIGQTIRTAGAIFLFGGTPLEYFQQYLARGTGPTRGREANVHWTSFEQGLLGPVSPLGTMVEVMAGITLAFRLRDEPRVGAVFGGDGQTSTGAWHEGVNFAAARRCPLIVVVQANQWAFSTPTRKQTRVRSFTEKAPGYGVPGVSVDGTDVLAVYDAAKEAADRARSGGGVTLIEARSYRMKGHAQHDAQDYVPREELEAWRHRDPLVRFRTRLLDDGRVQQAEIDALERRAHDVVLEAADQAVRDPLPEGSWALQDVYTDVTIPPPWTRVPGPQGARHEHRTRGTEVQ